MILQRPEASPRMGEGTQPSGILNDGGGVGVRAPPSRRRGEELQVGPDDHRPTTVRLRPFTGTDAAWYAITTQDPEIQRFTSERDDLTAAMVEQAINESAADPDREALLICGRDDDDRLGHIAIQRSGPSADLSYWVAPEARGHGVATRAIILACCRLQDHSDVRLVTLWAMADNVGSRRAAERAGFKITGLGHRRLRDRMILAADYERQLTHPAGPPGPIP